MKGNPFNQLAEQLDHAVLARTVRVHSKFGNVLADVAALLDQPIRCPQTFRAHRDAIIGRISNVRNNLLEDAMALVNESRTIEPRLPIVLRVTFKRRVSDGPFHINWRKKGSLQEMAELNEVLPTFSPAQSAAFNSLNTRRNRVAVAHTMLLHMEDALTRSYISDIALQAGGSKMIS
jgi:hypothetical protein